MPELETNPALSLSCSSPSIRPPQLKEKPHPGATTFKTASHLGWSAPNSLTASGIDECLYDSGRRTRSTGKERDAETTLDFFGARYFSAPEGRFASPDPLLNSGRPDLPQSWNKYAYALNNPLRYTDPTGLYEWDVTLGGDETDDELKRRAGKDKKARAAADEIIRQRKAIRDQISRLARSKDARLISASQAIGAENDSNGVTIGLGA